MKGGNLSPWLLADYGSVANCDSTARKTRLEKVPVPLPKTKPEKTTACPATYPSTMNDRPKFPPLSVTASATRPTRVYPTSSSALYNRWETMPEAGK